MQISRPLVLVLALLSVSAAAACQDSFEVQVYESQTAPPGKWEFDLHALFIQRGGTVWEGSVAPSENQAHLALEITRGITEEFEIGAYLLAARRQSEALQYAGFRIRPRVKAPECWDAPVGLSLSLELGFPQPRYEPNRISLEIRPIIDKKVGGWTFSINPLLSSALEGPETDTGPQFEPSMKVGYDVIPESFTLELEYIAALGPIKHFNPAGEQVHLLYPKVEFALSNVLTVNAGVGFGLTDAGDRLVWALRLSAAP
jgi:hypothetical protein